MPRRRRRGRSGGGRRRRPWGGGGRGEERAEERRLHALPDAGLEPVEEDVGPRAERERRVVLPRAGAGPVHEQVQRLPVVEHLVAVRDRPEERGREPRDQAAVSESMSRTMQGDSSLLCGKAGGRIEHDDEGGGEAGSVSPLHRCPVPARQRASWEAHLVPKNATLQPGAALCKTVVVYHGSS